MSPKTANAAEGKVTIKIPRPLYQHLSHIVAGSGFNSVTDFIVFVLRDLVSAKENASLPGSAAASLSSQEIEAIRTRLKSLGYF